MPNLSTLLGTKPMHIISRPSSTKTSIIFFHGKEKHRQPFLFLQYVYNFHPWQDLVVIKKLLQGSVADPDPSDPYVFGPLGFGSISTRNVSGFYHQAKRVRKTLIPTAL
jgi:hypothetical protein